MRAPVPTNRFSQNFGFYDLRSGECCDITIIRQWDNVEMPIFPKYEWERAIYLQYSYITPLSRLICGVDPMISP